MTFENHFSTAEGKLKQKTEENDAKIKKLEGEQAVATTEKPFSEEKLNELEKAREMQKKLQELTRQLAAIKETLQAKYNDLSGKINGMEITEGDARKIKENLLQTLNQIMESKTAQVANAAEMEVAALEAISTETTDLLKKFEGAELREGLEAIAFIMENRDAFVKVLARVEIYGKGKWGEIHGKLIEEMKTKLDAELTANDSNYKPDDPSSVKAREDLLKKKILAFQQFAELSMQDGLVGDQTSNAVFELLEIRNTEGNQLTMGNGEYKERSDEDTQAIIDKNKTIGTGAEAPTGTPEESSRAAGWGVDENGNIIGINPEASTNGEEITPEGIFFTDSNGVKHKFNGRVEDGPGNPNEWPIVEYEDAYYEKQKAVILQSLANLNLDTAGWGSGTQGRNIEAIVNEIIRQCKAKKIPVPQNIEGLKIWDHKKKRYVELSQGAHLGYGYGVLESSGRTQENTDMGLLAENIIATTSFNERHPELANRGFYEDGQGFMRAAGQWENGRGQIAGNGDIYWEQDGVVYKFDQVARDRWPNIRFTATDRVPNVTSLAQLSIPPSNA